MLQPPTAKHRATRQSSLPEQLTRHERHVLSETELAHRWGISPKTLQRWRSEGRGPQYLKLSKRVTYPLETITNYERGALHISTSERIASNEGEI